LFTADGKHGGLAHVEQLRVYFVPRCLKGQALVIKKQRQQNLSSFRPTSISTTNLSSGFSPTTPNSGNPHGRRPSSILTNSPLSLDPIFEKNNSKSHSLSVTHTNSNNYNTSPMTTTTEKKQSAARLSMSSLPSLLNLSFSIELTQQCQGFLQLEVARFEVNSAPSSSSSSSSSASTSSTTKSGGTDGKWVPLALTPKTKTENLSVEFSDLELPLQSLFKKDSSANQTAPMRVRLVEFASSSSPSSSLIGEVRLAFSQFLTALNNKNTFPLMDSARLQSDPIYQNSGMLTFGLGTTNSSSAQTLSAQRATPPDTSPLTPISANVSRIGSASVSTALPLHLNHQRKISSVDPTKPRKSTKKKKSKRKTFSEQP
jgi:hypothetical protein